jgi:hypothetical protein
MDPDLSRRQLDFLRRLIAADGTLPPDAWPSPLILRRWLRNDSFRRALFELRDGFRFQADLHLSAASARAAANLDTQLRDPDTTADLRDLIYTVRVAHLRERHDPTAQEPRPFLRPGQSQEKFDAALARLKAAHEQWARENPEEAAKEKERRRALAAQYPKLYGPPRRHG